MRRSFSEPSVSGSGEGHAMSEPSVSGSGEGHAMSSPVLTVEEAEPVEEVSAVRMAQRIPSSQEEQPSTSSGVQIDRAAQQSHEVSQGLYIYVSYYCILLCHFFCHFTALTLWVGWQEGHPARKN